MLDQYRKMSKKEFIKMIEEEYDDDAEFDVHTIDFDSKQKKSMVSHMDKRRINIIANDSKSIIFSGNKFESHVDIHSITQPDITNIKKKGVMRTILLDSIPG